MPRPAPSPAPRSPRSSVPAASTACGGGSSNTTGSTGGSSDPDAHVLLTSNRLTTFSSTNTASLASPVTLTGVAAGDTLVSIDRRPQNGVLYALGINATANTGTLYLLDPQTGNATAIGSAGQVAFVNALGNPVDLPDAATEGYGFNHRALALNDFQH